MTPAFAKASRTTIKLTEYVENKTETVIRHSQSYLDLRIAISHLLIQYYINRQRLAGPALWYSFIRVISRPVIAIRPRVTLSLRVYVDGGSMPIKSHRRSFVLLHSETCLNRYLSYQITWLFLSILVRKTLLYTERKKKRISWIS